MPRERVYGSVEPFGPDDIRRTVVDLSWSREAEYVQMGTIAIDGATGDPLDLHKFYAMSSEDRSDATGPFGGMYLQLDRLAINKLIRNLRRARDQAFGRDE